jgi:hypothetical protein
MSACTCTPSSAPPPTDPCWVWMGNNCPCSSINCKAGLYPAGTVCADTLCSGNAPPPACDCSQKVNRTFGSPCYEQCQNNKPKKLKPAQQPNAGPPVYTSSTNAAYIESLHLEPNGTLKAGYTYEAVYSAPACVAAANQNASDAFYQHWAGGLDPADVTAIEGACWQQVPKPPPWYTTTLGKAAIIGGGGATFGLLLYLAFLRAART